MDHEKDHAVDDTDVPDVLPLSVPAQDSGPTRVEELLLQDSMLVLWSMGLKESVPKNQDTLCRDLFSSSFCLKAHLLVAWSAADILGSSRTSPKTIRDSYRNKRWKRLPELFLLRK